MSMEKGRTLKEERRRGRNAMRGRESSDPAARHSCKYLFYCMGTYGEYALYNVYTVRLEREKGRDSCLYKTSLCDGSMNTFPMQSLPVTFRILCERRRGSSPNPERTKKFFIPPIPSAFSAHRTTIRSLSSRKIRKFPDRKKRA